MNVGSYLLLCTLAIDLSLTLSLSCYLSGSCQKKFDVILMRLPAIPTSTCTNAAISKGAIRGFGCHPLRATSASLPYLSDNTQSENNVSVDIQETSGKDKDEVQEKEERLKKIRAVGGPLSFNTKYGAINPFGVYWLLLSSSLGLVWFTLLQICRLFYWVTGNRLDKNKRIPIFFSHVWGTLLLRLSHSYPQIENREILNDLYSK
jgi:hypothetical protein